MVTATGQCILGALGGQARAEENDGNPLKRTRVVATRSFSENLDSR